MHGFACGASSEARPSSLLEASRWITVFVSRAHVNVWRRTLTKHESGERRVNHDKPVAAPCSVVQVLWILVFSYGVVSSCRPFVSLFDFLSLSAFRGLASVRSWAAAFHAFLRTLRSDSQDISLARRLVFRKFDVTIPCVTCCTFAIDMFTLCNLFCVMR